MAVGAMLPARRLRHCLGEGCLLAEEDPSVVRNHTRARGGDRVPGDQGRASADVPAAREAGTARKPSARSTREARAGPGTQRRPPSDKPDVFLDIPDVHVGEIHLDVESLDAHLSLQARLANLVELVAGVHVHIDKVELDIKDVGADNRAAPECTAREALQRVGLPERVGRNSSVSGLTGPAWPSSPSSSLSPAKNLEMSPSRSRSASAESAIPSSGIEAKGAAAKESPGATPARAAHAGICTIVTYAAADICALARPRRDKGMLLLEASLRARTSVKVAESVTGRPSASRREYRNAICRHEPLLHRSD